MLQIDHQEHPKTLEWRKNEVSFFKRGWILNHRCQNHENWKQVQTIWLHWIQERITRQRCNEVFPRILHRHQQNWDQPGQTIRRQLNSQTMVSSFHGIKCLLDDSLGQRWWRTQGKEKATEAQRKGDRREEEKIQGISKCNGSQRKRQ